MISYEQLIIYLKKQKVYPISLKSKYVVILVPGSKYHVTIFQDQWDEYQNVTGLPYHLFHISSDHLENRCSSYFWVKRSNYRIKKIPKKYFQYGQPAFGFYSSTRMPCSLSEIIFLLKKFQGMLNKIIVGSS